jgi:hypothetical protein
VHCLIAHPEGRQSSVSGLVAKTLSEAISRQVMGMLHDRLREKGAI